MFDKFRIKEHMEVVGKNGQHIGTVDEKEGDRVKLTKSSDSHHFRRASPPRLHRRGHGRPRGRQPRLLPPQGRSGRR